jgi:membrane protease YdiL (CAAX protease family)
MFKCILAVWFAANFLIVGIASWFSGSWYLGWGVIPAILAEIGLIMVPNLVLPVLLLRVYPLYPAQSFSMALGWNWTGRRAAMVGGLSFGVAYGLDWLITHFLGPGIPYNLPGQAASIGPVHEPIIIVGLLLALAVLVSITVAGEETLFRGLIQTYAVSRLGPWLGLGIAAVLFGLRHLPADLFYAKAWGATPRMWLSRELQLYTFALILGLARLWGRSAWASAMAHALLYFFNLFGG